MLEKIYQALEKTNNIRRSSYVWNAISAMMLAVQSPVILMVMTRTNGIKDAGIFSIGIAVANLMMYVGQYGIRRFQSSDVKEQFSFQEYHGLRIISCAVMFVVCMGYCCFGKLFRGYSDVKSIVVFAICMLKLIQAYSDVFHGNMQQKDRLDVATKVSALRYFLEIVIFSTVLLVTRDILKASIITVVLSVVIMFMTSYHAAQHFCNSMKPVFHIRSIKNLMIEGFPLFVSMFLNIYIGNAPKYAIDAALTDDVQAIFNIIIMPAFVVQIATQFLFNPIITSYANLWLAYDMGSYRKLMVKIKNMNLAVLGLTLLGLTIAATIGIPVLSIVFGIKLAGYRGELCIIMLGGGLLAFSTYFSTVIAIIREQRYLIVAYVITAAVAFVLSEKLVIAYNITGACIAYSCCMGLLALILGVVMFRKIAAEKHNRTV